MASTRRAILAAAAGFAGFVRAGIASAGGPRPFATPVAAPPLALSGLDGRVVDLAEQAGRPALVCFWATWCAPCRAELPALARLNRDLTRDEGVVMAVNIGEPADKVRRFLAQIGADGFPTLLDEERTTAAPWRIGGLPLAYGVAPDGRLAFSVVGATDWDDPAMRQALRGLASPTRGASLEGTAMMGGST
jgi:thiol-disulfide isomerase/thioredoxin